MKDKIKKYETIGCCGIDCGLCPRFYTKGDSACPGCGGNSFKEKHPSCGIVPCCVIKKEYEVCADCPEFPYKRYDAEKHGYDSFVTHKKVFFNLDYIKDKEIALFIENQKLRMAILTNLLSHFDDGRSKSFYCHCCALLPLERLQEVQKMAHNLNNSKEQKEKIKLIKDALSKIATTLSIELKLNTKK